MEKLNLQSFIEESGLLEEVQRITKRSDKGLLDENASFTTYGSPKVKVMSYGFGDIYGTPEVNVCAGNPTLKIHDEFSNVKMTGLNITVTHGTVISQRPFDTLKLGGFAIHRMEAKGIIRTREGDIQLKYKEHLKQM